MTNQIFDNRTVGDVRKTRDGYLTGRVRAARTGIQDYEGKDLGKPEIDVLRVYRPEDEVFKRDSMASYVGKPITLGHPQDRVTADNHRSLARGHIAGVARDGESIVLEVAITDAETVKLVEGNGPKGLSAGYVTQIDWTPGETSGGQKYDAIQREIFVDHLAIVPIGRAGAEFRIGDQVPDDGWGIRPLNPKPIEQKKEAPMADALNTTVQVGDGAVQTNEAGAIRIKSLQDGLKTAQDEIQSLKDKNETLTKDVQTKDGKIKVLEKSLKDATSPSALSDMAKKRAKMFEKGKKADLKEEDMDKMTDADIAKAIVTKVLGDEWVKANDGADFAVVADTIDAMGGQKAKTTDSALGAGVNFQDADSWAFINDKKKKGAA